MTDTRTGKCSSYEEREGGEKKSGLAQRISKLSCRERRAKSSWHLFPEASPRKSGAERVSAERGPLDRAEVGRPAWECSSHTSCVLFDPWTSMEDRLVVGYVMGLGGSRTTDTRGGQPAITTLSKQRTKSAGTRTVCLSHPVDARPQAPRSYGVACGRPVQAMVWLAAGRARYGDTTSEPSLARRMGQMSW